MQLTHARNADLLAAAQSTLTPAEAALVGTVFPISAEGRRSLESAVKVCLLEMAQARRRAEGVEKADGAERAERAEGGGEKKVLDVVDCANPLFGGKSFRGEKSMSAASSAMDEVPRTEDERGDEGGGRVVEEDAPLDRDPEEEAAFMGWFYIPAKPEARQVRLTPVRKYQSVGRSEGNTIVIADEPMLIDGAKRRCPRVFLCTFQLWNIIQLMNLLLMPLYHVALPFAILEYTNTTHVVWGEYDGNTNSSGSSGGDSSMGDDAGVAAGGPPWAPGWVDTSLILSDIYSCTQMYYFLYICVLCPVHWGTLRAHLRHDFLRLFATWGTSVGYFAVAVSLRPDRSHILWLAMFKIAMVFELSIFDAFAVGITLRLQQKKFEEYSPPAGQRGWCSFGALNSYSFLLLVLDDIVRHYLLLFFARDLQIITFSVANPFTGGNVQFTNRQLATSLFWTSLVFSGQILWDSLVRKLWRTTVMMRTVYNITLEERGGGQGTQGLVRADSLRFAVPAGSSNLPRRSGSIGERARSLARSASNLSDVSNVSV